jgi:hypothetical protein
LEKKLHLPLRRFLYRTAARTLNNREALTKDGAAALVYASLK